MGSPMTNAWGTKMLRDLLMAVLSNCTATLDEPVKAQFGRNEAGKAIQADVRKVGK